MECFHAMVKIPVQIYEAFSVVIVDIFSKMTHFVETLYSSSNILPPM